MTSAPPWRVVTNVVRRYFITLLFLLLTLGLNGQAGAFAYRGQQGGENTGPTNSGEAIAWHPREVSMGLNFGSQWNDAARLALQQWNETDADFTWHADANSAAPCVNDGINSTGWADSGCSGDWGSVIATTRVSMTRIGGKWYINDTDVLFNSTLQFNRYSGPLRYDADGRPVYDFIRIALHEFGHAAGLLHPDAADQQVDAVMNTGNRSLALDHLQEDDIQGLRSLYAGERTQADIYFSGFNGYRIADGRIFIDLDRVHNRRATTSNTLTLEIRANEAGNGADYYLLGQIELDRLAGGEQRDIGWTNAAYTHPPNGLHSISLVLLEAGTDAPLYRQAIGYLDQQGISSDNDTPAVSGTASAAMTNDQGGGAADVGLLLAALITLGRRLRN